MEKPRSRSRGLEGVQRVPTKPHKKKIRAVPKDEPRPGKGNG